MKRKRLKILSFLICICFLLTIFGYTQSVDTYSYSNTENITVHLTGNGIATRLHKPILDEFDNITTEFVHIDDGISKSNEHLDAWLFLGTPVYKHKNHIINACKSYDKILCEKPVTLSLDEIAQIKEAINQNNTLFRVNYALRFLPDIQEILEFINNNDVKSVSIICNANFNIKPGNKEWKNDYKLGGGILYSIFPHFVDLLNYLGCQADLDSIYFESTQQIPMNDISFSSKALKGYDANININLCEDFDQLILKVETTDKTKVFDLINVPESIIDGTKYPNGTLSATSEISPWRISFKHLLENLFTNPNDFRFASIEDAENVHKVLNVILTNSEL